MDINKVVLMGRLGADPIRRETSNGLPVTSFSMATSRRGREEGATQTQWHRVVAWGKQAEACASYLKKGHLAYLEGSLRSRSYDAKDGSSKMAFEVHIERIIFLGRRVGMLGNGVPTESGAEPAEGPDPSGEEQALAS